MHFSIAIDETSNAIYDRINRRAEHITRLKSNRTKEESEPMLVSLLSHMLKLERFFCLRINIGTQRKLLNFENWINGGLRSFQKSEF